MRVQQRFAPDSTARLGFKKEADDLEDKMAARKRALELTNMGASDAVASRISTEEVKRNRLLSNMEEAGTPEMSSIAKMGGSAGFAGVVGGPDDKSLQTIKDLNVDIAKNLAALLGEMKKAQAKADQMGKDAAKNK